MSHDYYFIENWPAEAYFRSLWGESDARGRFVVVRDQLFETLVAADPHHRELSIHNGRSWYHISASSVPRTGILDLTENSLCF